jgi:prepilin-type N-terminal cleavage/methylation domain-containing protein
MSPRTRRTSPPRGFTLLEMLVTLLLMAVAAALAVPALRSIYRPAPSVGTLLPLAREAAVRRGETIFLRIDASGRWRLEGAASASAEALGSGRIEPFPGLPITLVVSPLGACALDAESAARDPAISVDALTCSVRDGG